MASKRLARLGEQLKREISELIRRDVHDPRVGAVTVTGARVSGDLSVAWVYVRPLAETPEEAEETLAGLHAAAPFLRRTLGRSLHVRRIPELRFEVDRTLEKASEIERILSEVVIPDEVDDGDDGGSEE
ncbi:MAG: 30S ribosome-binding factor RbfA [Gemmatimonadota bacterium]|nr:30S ribosome-binding factor RbfA [Gemmatimonadota bacterium]MDH5760246.1 30S ribosome-binding factor RbfA [Gemmatimonadota bacterium]